MNPVVHFLPSIPKCSLTGAGSVLCDVKLFTVARGDWLARALAPPERWLLPSQRLVFQRLARPDGQGAQDVRSGCCFQHREVLMPSGQVHATLTFCSITLRERTESRELLDHQESKGHR